MLLPTIKNIILELKDMDTESYLEEALGEETIEELLLSAVWILTSHR